MKNHCFWMLSGLVAALFSFLVSVTPAYAMAEEPAETVEAASEEGEPLSEGSGIVTRDLLYDKATNKQFLTIQDREGNIFYLVIDYDAPVDEEEEQYQTYFLNPVDTDDLAALAEENEEEPIVCSCKEHCQAGAVNMDCELCAKDMTECAGIEPEVEEPDEPENSEVEVSEEEPEEEFNPAVFILVFALLGGGGAFAYLKLVKGKQKAKAGPNPDDYGYGMEDEDDSEYEFETESEEELEEEGEQGEEETEKTDEEDRADKDEEL